MMQKNDWELIDPEDAAINRFEEEENSYLNDYFAEHHDPENPMDDETKNSLMPGLKREWITKKICSQDFKRAFSQFKSYKVIKYGRFFQSLFYFLKYEREQICEESTNKLCWKKAKGFFNDNLYQWIQSYSPIGPKDGEYKWY